MASIYAKIVDREGILNGLLDAARADLSRVEVDSLLDAKIPLRGGVLGKWNLDGDPFTDVLIVNDQDVNETFAWLPSYFAAVAPISQWCRILPRSDLVLLAEPKVHPTLNDKLGGWIGMVIAECSVQSGYSVNLRELPGTAAASCASFAAARAIAVWGENADLSDVVTRHEELGTKLRDGQRLLNAARLLPIWVALNAEQHLITKFANWRSLEPFALLVNRITSANPSTREATAEIVSFAVEHFRLPEIARCAHGPQLERVKGLDQLAAALSREKPSITSDAILGFAASLIDLGAAVMPDLLRKYQSAFPLAPCWLGAFAGCWSTPRVLADHAGLGRLVAKMLLADTDIHGKPHCDISYDELSRWLNGVVTSKLPLRGTAARSLNVELVLGVSCPFALGRSDGNRSEMASPPVVARREESYEQQRSRASQDKVAFLARSLDALTKRVEATEKFMTSLNELHRKSASEGAQRDLLENVDGPSGSKSPRKKK